MNPHTASGELGYPDEFAEWDEWRPKPHEQIDEDVSEKTAKQASIDEGEGEKARKSPDEDIQTAVERLTESYEKLEKDNVPSAVEKAGVSVEYVARAADTAGRKALRIVEDTVYQRVMTQLSPYYFDNELISATLQQFMRDEKEEFIFEVNINNDELKAKVSERLAEYEETVNRWHVTTDRKTDVVEAMEGIEVPEPDDRTQPTSN